MPIWGKTKKNQPYIKDKIPVSSTGQVLGGSGEPSDIIKQKEVNRLLRGALFKVGKFNKSFDDMKKKEAEEEKIISNMKKEKNAQNIKEGQKLIEEKEKEKQQIIEQMTKNQPIKDPRLIEEQIQIRGSLPKGHKNDFDFSSLNLADQESFAEAERTGRFFQGKSPEEIREAMNKSPVGESKKKTKEEREREKELERLQGELDGLEEKQKEQSDRLSKTIAVLQQQAEQIPSGKQSGRQPDITIDTTQYPELSDIQEDLTANEKKIQYTQQRMQQVLNGQSGGQTGQVGRQPKERKDYGSNSYNEAYLLPLIGRYY